MNIVQDICVMIIVVTSVNIHTAYTRGVLTDSCKNNTCYSDHNIYYLTGEENEKTYIYIGKTATLRCCKPSENHTVKWYKDGYLITHDRQYRKTTFVLKDYCKHEVIASDQVWDYDTGNYTCKVINGNGHIHSIASVQVTTDIECEDYKEPTAGWVQKPENKYALTGDQNLNISCAANIGFCNERKRKSRVFWNVSSDESTRNYAVENKMIETEGNGWVFQSTLIFKTISDEDFGNYTCIVSITDEQEISQTISLINGYDPKAKLVPTASYTVAIVLLVTFIITFMTTVFIAVNWRLEICLFLKDHFGDLEEDDKKKYDIVVIYDLHDIEFVCNIVKTLEEYYQYKCYLYDRDALGGESRLDVLRTVIPESKRLVMILTASSLSSNHWCLHSLCMAIVEKLNMKSKIICIMKDITTDDINNAPEADKSEKSLGQILKVIKKVNWEPSGSNKQWYQYLNKLSSKFPQNFMYKKILQSLEEKYETEEGSGIFWKNLLLYLPPRRDIRCPKNAEVVTV